MATKILAIDSTHKEARIYKAADAFQKNRTWSHELWGARKDSASGITQVDAANWDGADLTGKSIVVLAEQGIGDQIMFLKSLGETIQDADAVVLECDVRLVPLFERSFQDVQCVRWSKPPQPTISHARFDYKIAMADLLGDGSLLAAGPYLTADRNLTERLRERYLDGKTHSVVGIAWHSGNLLNGPFRSLPLDRWTDILRMPNCRFVNLQYGDRTAELDGIEARFGVNVLNDSDIDSWQDLDGFAAQVAAMDAVVTIDNSTVHMAGALGVPTLVMLPVAADWRWLREGQSQLWYRLVDIVRQRVFGEWDDVIGQAVDWLANQARQTTS